MANSFGHNGHYQAVPQKHKKDDDFEIYLFYVFVKWSDDGLYGRK